MRMLLPTLTSIANLRRPGASSRKSSRRLAAKSGPWSERPVTLPPGRERLLTNPLPTGSTARAKTIGIVDVACLTAETALLVDYFNCAPVYPTMFAQLSFKGGNRLCPQLLGHSSKKPDTGLRCCARSGSGHTVAPL